MGDHDDHDHHEHDEGADLSGWATGAQKTTCPACGASGALMLGGGIFCPSCGEVTTNPGYGPAADPDPD